MKIEDMTTFDINGERCIALVRKLTVRECGRLMGVDDADIDRMIASGISKSKLYKLFGNSIVVDVLYHIFRTAFIENEVIPGDLFSMMTRSMAMYNNENPLRVVTLCSGYDSQCLALERLKRDYPPFDYDLVAWSEFDPESDAELSRQPAVVAHNALFPQWKDRNLGDMTKIDWTKVPDFDLLFYSTPCQSISQAGLQHGFVEGSGTRSSIIWNVRDALKIKHPSFCCMENVAAMVDKKNKPVYDLWCEELCKFGYDNYPQVLNAKEYGVPQNRKRIFLFSQLRDVGDYRFPKAMPLTVPLESLFEEEADVGYYVNVQKTQRFLEDNRQMIDEFIRKAEEPIPELPDRIRKLINETPDTQQ